MKTKKDIYYCDSDNYEYEDCIHCPRNAICMDGKIVDCFGKYILIDDEKCIPESKYEDLVEEMTSFTSNLIASVNGDNICYDQSKFNLDQLVYIDNLQKQIKRKFKRYSDYNGAIRIFNKSILKSYHTDYDMYDRYYLISNNVSFSFYCKCKIMFSKYTLRILIILFFLSFAIYMLLKEIKSNKYYYVAEEIYKKILKKLQHRRKVGLIRCRIVISPGNILTNIEFKLES